MTPTNEALTRAVQKAIDNGWRPSGDISGLSFRVDPFAMVTKFDDIAGESYKSLNDIIFNHDFARALWKDGETPEAKEAGSYDAVETLGLYRASGGGYDGYGDYVNLEFTGEPWQYHLQQMVISPDPIKYLQETT